LGATTGHRATSLSDGSFVETDLNMTFNRFSAVNPDRVNGDADVTVSSVVLRPGANLCSLLSSDFGSENRKSP